MPGKIKKSASAAVAALIAFIAAAGFASGHGFDLSFEKEVGDYVVDVGIYVAELSAWIPVQFDFLLWNKDRTETPEFTDAWVRIESVGDGSVIFSGNIIQTEFGFTGMNYMFPRAGDYVLSVRFQNQGKTVTEADFPIQVASGLSETKGIFSNHLFVGAFIGFAAGALLILFLKRKKT